MEGSSTIPPSARIGPYRLLHELGRGGQAIVWLAEDTRIGRQVALKVLPFAGPGAAEALKRFRREAEVASRLAHSCICPVFDADLDAGAPYIAMRFIPGETLARRIERQRESRSGTPGPEHLRELVVLLEKVARALHAAHEAGIVHRDVKPANLMITPEGEPVILDFGLAREDDGSGHALSASAETSGTPAYMSPEQLTGRARPDRRADVWALGIVLHEAATLDHPFASVTREGLFHAILSENAAGPRRANPAVDRDLATILETATAKERDRRYQTALDLAEDMRRWIANEPIRARPVSRIERAVLWVRRKPALAASFLAIGILVAAAGGLLAYGILASGRARTESELRSVAESERKRADEAFRALKRTEREAQLLEDLDLVNMEVGTLMFGFDSAGTVATLQPRYVAALRGYGFELGAPGADDDMISRLVEMRPRTPKLHAVVIESFRNLGFISLLTDPERRESWSRTVFAVLASVPEVTWPELDAAKESWRTDHVDTFDALLEESVLATKSSAQIDELAGALVTIPNRIGDAKRVIERALESDPGSFRLHFLAGALGFMQLKDRSLLSATDVERAGQSLLHHISVAVALRPRSAFVRAMLAMAQAATARYEQAAKTMDEATTLEPSNALVWLFKARFYAFWPDPRPGIEACRKAAELDPDLGGVRELQAEFEARLNGR